MRLCVALDLPSFKENIYLARQIREHDLWLKIGFRSYIRDGKKIVQELKEINPNFKLFLDLKLYDIPNTMADASYEIGKLGIDMFNVHASSGSEAMKMVMERVSEFKNPPKVLAVTVLTSFDEVNFQKVYNVDIAKAANNFATIAYKNGVNGVVCSAFESKEIKEKTDLNFITLTPGIRPFLEDKGDQKRVADLKKAKEELVDFIVVGRPIYNSSDPKKIVDKILDKI